MNTNALSRRLPAAFFTLFIALAATAFWAMPVTAHGQMFLVRNDNNTGHGFISEYTTAGVLVSGTLVSSGDASWSGAIALSGSNLFVGDGLFGTIEEYTTSGATVSTTLVTGLGEPTGIAVSKDGKKLFVTDNSNGTVGEYDAVTGLPVGDTLTGGLVTGLTNPQKIVVSGSNLFVVDPDVTGTNGAIREYTVDAAAGTVTSSNASLVTGLINPTGIAVSGTNLYVTMGGAAGAIGVYSTSGATVNADLASVGRFPGSIAVSGSNLFVIGYVGSQVIGNTVSGNSGTVLVTGLVASGGNVDGIAAVGTSAGNSPATAPVFTSPLTFNTAPNVDTMVMGDFDGDGVPDVAVLDATSGVVEVHYGDGAGGFRATVGSFSVTSSNGSYRGMAASDLAGSGTSELVFATGSSVQIYEIQSSGSFAQTRADGTTPWTPIDLTASGINATKVAVGDLTAAGSRDILVSDDDGTVGVVWIPNDGTGNFGTPAAFAANGCGQFSRPILIDVDGDGLPDVVLNGGSDNQVRVLLNNGDRTLGAPTAYGNSSLPSNFIPVAATVADIERSGFPDLVQVGYVQNSSTSAATYYLSVNTNNANGTFADGQTFTFSMNNGVSIGANAIEAADFDGDGSIGIATLYANPADGTTGFTISQWTGTGATLALARQDSFAGDGMSYSSLLLGYTNDAGAFVTLNNDPLPDVLVGVSSEIADILDQPPASEIIVFRNIFGSTPPPGRDLNFASATYDVSEGGSLDVTVTRGAGSTGQILAPFIFGGSAIQGGTNTKGVDYTITSPPSQEITFGTSDYSETIHIATAAPKGKQPDKTILLTLLEPEGNTELGSGSTTIITIHSTDPSTIGSPGALSVKPTNVVKPIPIGFGSDIKVAGRTGSLWNFSVSQAFPSNATNASVIVQVSLAPPSANQWTNLTNLTQGKGSSWSGYSLFPPTSISEVYFRTVANADGYPEHDGAPTQPFAVIGGPDLTVALTGSSASDSSGDTAHRGEALVYQIVINNVSPDTAATDAVLTVPIPKNSTFVEGTDPGSLKQTKDSSGRTKSVTWTYTEIPSNGTITEDLSLTVDPTASFGDVIAETGYKLSSIEEKSAYNLPNPLGYGRYGQEFDTVVLGSIKVTAGPTNAGSSVDPGGLITYTLLCENDASTPLSGAIATDVIPAGTELATVYAFDSSGNAETTPLPNPGPLTNPALIYSRTAFKPNITLGLITLFGHPTGQELSLLYKIWKASAGTELDPGTGPDVAALAQILPNGATDVNTLINDGFITPARIVWMMPAIPGFGPGNSNQSTVAFQVRVPYDASPTTTSGSQVVIVNGTYTKSKKPATYLNDRSSYDFIIPSTNTSALYGDPPPQILTVINNVPPSLNQPYLFIEKCAKGDQNLNNPNFNGSGYSTLPYLGDVVNVAANHGVDYQLIYRNDLDINGNGADAHGVVLHDVIPQGMELCGFFTQNIMDSGTGPMFAPQFTFYDKDGNLIPGVDPNSNQSNMALVRSMDIRLGSVANITVLPKGTHGYIEYTCQPTITPQYVYTFPDWDLDIAPGVVHSFGGFQPGQGLSGKYQGFYISTSDQLTPVQGCPDDCLVQVVADVSWNFPPPTYSINDSQPFDVVPVDFNFTQNGAVSAPNTVINFSVPPGVTLLNNAAFVPPANAVVSTGGSNHYVADGSTSYDCRPYLVNANTVLGMAQTGTNVQITLGTVDGQTSDTVRVFFQVNGPVLDPGITAAGGFEPVNAQIVGSYVPAPAAGVIQAFAATMQTAGATTGGHSLQRVHALSGPKLGITRPEPYSVQKGTPFSYTIHVTNHGDTAATNVTIGMEVPWRTTYVATDNGQLQDGSTGTVIPSANPTAWTVARQRDASQIKGTGPGPDIINWTFASLPPQSSCQVTLTVLAGSQFADQAIEDHSAFVSADNAGTIHIAADPVTVWIFDQNLNESKIQAAQTFFQNSGITVTPGLDAAVALVAQSMTSTSQVNVFGGLDLLQLVGAGVKIIPLRKGQVLLISQDGAAIVASGAGNVVSNDGGSLVVQGAASGITVSTGVTGLGTQTAEYLLNNIPSIVASGAGNIVASGAGNLISYDGGSILSNEVGGGIIAPISSVANGITFSGDGGRALLQSGGNAVAAGAGLISQDGGALISQDGGALISQDGGALISQDGGALNGGLTISHTGVVSNDGGSLVPQDGR